MIDPNIQQRLRIRFNPNGSSLRNQQLRMLEILSYIDKVCKDNDIKYWLSSGTLLGAVRHHGFIPWDDDLDVEMLRKDYVKFEKAFIETENFTLQTCKNDKYYTNYFSKVRDKKSRIDQKGYNNHCKYDGLFVDVFSLEKIPYIIYFIYASIFFFMIQLHRLSSKTKILLPIVLALKKITFISIPIARLVSKVIPIKKLRHSYGGAPFWKPREQKDIFPLTEMEFEGKSFPVPGNYDMYLKRLYGNYMALPNIDTIRIHYSDCDFFC